MNLLFSASWLTAIMQCLESTFCCLQMLRWHFKLLHAQSVVSLPCLAYTRLEYPSVINIIMGITYTSMHNRVAASMKIKLSTPLGDYCTI